MVKKAPTFSRPGKASVEKPYQVFVSHATADKWLAKTICEKIEVAGATFFRDDRDIHGGDDIPDEIRRQIKQSREVIVILTPESVGRQWVTLEVGAAWGWSKKVRIIVLMNHVSVDPIPDMLKNKKAIPLNDFDQYLVELRHRVRDHHEGR
jgi:hypothetical protein